MTALTPPAPAIAPVAAEKFWQRLDRIGSYIFAALILALSLGTTVAAVLYKIFS